ncbi:MAG: hypothetical protein FH748_01525 [Balneolaceae bacterium]|nr:hypothetical protein [Balneolaceae bacterium]
MKSIRIRGILTIICVIGFALSTQAQHTHEEEYQDDENIINVSSLNKTFHSLDVSDIQDGIDGDFYSGSSFGLRNLLYSAYPVLQPLRFNRVDGLFLGIENERMNYNKKDFLGIESIDLHGMIGYSVGQQNWQYAAGLEAALDDDKNILIGGELHNSTSTNDYWRLGRTENSITALSAGHDYYDYFNVEGYGAYVLIKAGNVMELGASYNADIYSSLDISSQYSVFGDAKNYRPNPAIDQDFDEINQESVTLGLTLNPGQSIKNSLFSSTLSVKAEIANLPSSVNDFLYNKYVAETKLQLKLNSSSIVQWRMLGSSITGDAPDFKKLALGGIGTMRATGYKHFTGNQMLLSNLEIEFGKSSNSNKHNWADLKHTSLSLFIDSGWTQSNSNLFTADSSPFDGFERFSFSNLSHNAGIGLGYEMVRFEVATPIAGAEGATTFWVRFNPTF